MVDLWSLDLGERSLDSGWGVDLVTHGAPGTRAAAPWEEAWQEALYGARGFYRRPEGPSGHFETAASGTTAPALARALIAFAATEGLDRIIDLGAGNGDLLRAMYAVRSPGSPAPALAGVEVRGRPADLPPDVEWLLAPGGGQIAPLPEAMREGVLVVAHEWLDNVPCPIATIDDSGQPRYLLVQTPGDGASQPTRLPMEVREELGELVTGDDLRWCRRWWPGALSGPASSARPDDGVRIEIGLPRDRAWDRLAESVTHGTLLAIDYGHTRADRPDHGSLTGFRQGHQVPPRPDGRCDLTAHVAVDSLTQDERHRQRDILARLTPAGHRPDPSLARTEPARYLRLLAESSHLAALREPAGYGDFWWVIRRVGHP